MRCIGSHHDLWSKHRLVIEQTLHTRSMSLCTPGFAIRERQLELGDSVRPRILAGGLAKAALLRPFGGFPPTPPEAKGGSEGASGSEDGQEVRCHDIARHA